MRSAGNRSAEGASALERVDIAVVTGLAITAAIVILVSLGAQSLATWDEAIYGVVSRELLERPGLTLHYGGHPWFEKPPLLFWLMSGSSSLLGVTEFALRLPTAIFAIGTIVLQYLVGRRLGGPLAGLLAAVLLLGVPQFLAYSRMAMMDVPLAALGMLSLALLIYGNKHPVLTWAAGAAFGLAILTKSVAAFLFVPGLLAMAVAYRGYRFLWSKELLLALALTLAVALPWHVWSVVTYGHSFLEQYFFFHVVGRFLAPLEGHEGDPFYYFNLYSDNAGLLAPVHAAGIVLAAILAIAQRNRSLAAVVALAVGAFVIVSLQGTKIGWYLTPVYPGAALAAALAIMKLLRTSRARVTALLIAALLAIPGIMNGRGAFVENYNILDYSPEIRSLKDTQPFANGRVPLLYTLGVSNPAPRFYLADQVQSIEEWELERLLAKEQSFLCLTFKSEARKFVSTHPHLRIETIASTPTLALIGYR